MGSIDAPGVAGVARWHNELQRMAERTRLGIPITFSSDPRHAAEWGQSVMGHSVKSPLFNALEALIEEQVGRDLDCPNGAGVLRRADGSACRDRTTGLPITGSGGEHWCINCHAPLAPAMISMFYAQNCRTKG